MGKKTKTLTFQGLYLFACEFLGLTVLLCRHCYATSRIWVFLAPCSSFCQAGTSSSCCRDTFSSHPSLVRLFCSSFLADIGMNMSPQI